MTFSATRKNIESYFATNFSGVASSKIAWDNVNYDPSNDDAWVRFNIQSLPSNFVGLGGSSVKVRRQGLLFVQVFAVEGKGALKTDEVAENVLATLEGKQLSTGETFQAGSKVDVGNDGSGWYQVNVVLPFYYDEYRTL